MLENNLFDDEEKKIFDEEAKKDENFFANELKKKNEKKGKEKGGKDKGEIILSEEEEDSFKEEDDDENQEKGIIQKKLKILVINGELPGAGGQIWVEAKALVQNGTNNDVIWGKENRRFVERDVMNNLYKSKDSWNDKASLCCGGSGSAVMQLHPDKIASLDKYAVNADVVVLVNTDNFVLNKENGLDKKFKDMLNFRKVILYGNYNKNLNSNYPGDKSNRKYLNYEDGCKNLLKFIQEKVDEEKPNFSEPEIKPIIKLTAEEAKEEYEKLKKNLVFKAEVKAEEAKLNIAEEAKLHINEFEGKKGKKGKKEKKEKKIEKLSDFEEEKEQKRLFDKVKQYAKKNPKKTKAGMVAGAGIIEELVGQLLFGKSILGGIFGYNSNPKEKDAKNVKDNKKDEKKSDKKVNNSGNQVK